MSLTPVPVALRSLLASVPGPTAAETLPLAACAGRTLAADVAALRTQPPFSASAMDGYAVRGGDIAVGARLDVIGEAAAGRSFAGTVSAGTAVRIFTGAPVPEGADTILMQEKADGVGTGRITVRQGERPGAFLRPAGLDFRAGEILLAAGTRLDSASLGLAAAMGHPALPVRRRPLVAILATGDELVLPGEPVGPNQIVASNGFALAALVEAAGGEVLDLGIAVDDRQALAAKVGAARAQRADVLLTLGGASVGDHDLVQSVLTAEGMTLGFWKIAMRPGKPMLQGVLGGMVVLGLPGNPVSSVVCGHLFVKPLVRALLGDPAAEAEPGEPARIGIDLPANDEREDYMRATLARDDSGWIVTPFPRQDSSMLTTLARADALLVRPIAAPAAKAGDFCRIIRLH